MADVLLRVTHNLAVYLLWFVFGLQFNPVILTHLLRVCVCVSVCDFVSLSIYILSVSKSKHLDIVAPIVFSLWSVFGCGFFFF